MLLPKGPATYILLRSWPLNWDSYPLFIKICFVISIVALLGIVLAMADIYIWRTVKRRMEAKAAELSRKISQLLMTVVVMEPAAQKDNLSVDTHPFVQLGLRNKYVAQALVNEMISYRNYFSGVIADRVRKLYLALSLDKDARAKLRKRNWVAKASALSELFRMDVEVDHDSLQLLAEAKNRYIRDFALLSLLKFTKGDPLDHLREINEPISQWQAFEIFLLFRQKENYTLSSLEGLISLDKEYSVVSLCLKLAVHFKVVAAVKLIIDLTQTPDLKLRAEAISALGQMEAEQAEIFLTRIYYEEPHEIQLKILTALGRIPSEKSLAFLEAVFMSSDDFEIKKHASDAIISLYPMSKNTINNLLNDSGALDHKILSHSLDPLINAV